MKSEHRLFFENVQKNYSVEFSDCKAFVLNYLRKVTEEYLLSQNVVKELKREGISTSLEIIYGEEKFHQLLGMMIYDVIMIDLKNSIFKDWEYTKTELSERDYLQSVYFKSKKKLV